MSCVVDIWFFTVVRILTCSLESSEIVTVCTVWRSILWQDCKMMLLLWVWLLLLCVDRVESSESFPAWEKAVACVIAELCLVKVQVCAGPLQFGVPRKCQTWKTACLHQILL
jgi:hypothetical protein